MIFDWIKIVSNNPIGFNVCVLEKNVTSATWTDDTLVKFDWFFKAGDLQINELFLLYVETLKKNFELLQSNLN